MGLFGGLYECCTLGCARARFEARPLLCPALLCSVGHTAQTCARRGVEHSVRHGSTLDLNCGVALGALARVTRNTYMQYRKRQAAGRARCAAEAKKIWDWKASKQANKMGATLALAFVEPG